MKRSNLIQTLAAIVAGLLAVSSANGAWVAYHDLASAIGDESTGNITNHHTGVLGSSGSLDTSAKSLIQYADGADTGVDVTIAGANGTDFRNGVTAPPDGGTPADPLFNVAGLNLTNGLIVEGGNSGSGATTYTFTGLKTDRFYDLAFYGDRSASSDGVERFTLGGSEGAFNTSSTGIQSAFVSDVNTRPNQVAGEYPRWSNIAPGADGTITVTVDPEVTSISNIAYLSALRLEEEASSVLYRETFGNTANQELTDADWIGYYGSSATQLTSGSGSSNIPFAAGASPGADPINSDLDGDEPNNGVTANGLVRLLHPGGSTVVSPGLVYTDEFTIDRNRWRVDTIRWDQAVFQVASENFRVAIEIDGQWFVSDESFAGPLGPGTGGFAGAAAEKSLDFQNALWRSLSFTPGSTLGAPGSLVALPDGDITAFGLYASFNRTMWFDTFTIEGTAIPAPAAMPAGLAMLGLAATRRRRNR